MNSKRSESDVQPLLPLSSKGSRHWQTRKSKQDAHDGGNDVQKRGRENEGGDNVNRARKCSVRVIVCRNAGEQSRGGLYRRARKPAGRFRRVKSKEREKRRCAHNRTGDNDDERSPRRPERRRGRETRRTDRQADPLSDSGGTLTWEASVAPTKGGTSTTTGHRLRCKYRP